MNNYIGNWINTIEYWTKAIKIVAFLNKKPLHNPHWGFLLRGITVENCPELWVVPVGLIFKVTPFK